VSTPPGPSEEELRTLEAELSRLRLEDVVVENAVTMVNLAFRRTGLAPGTEGERDPDQVRVGIDAVSALMPVLERVAPEQAVSALRDALSQLQLAFVRLQGSAAAPQAGAGPPPATEGGGAPSPPPEQATPPAPGAAKDDPSKPGETGPAQRSGRLWVPGS